MNRCPLPGAMLLLVFAACPAKETPTPWRHDAGASVDDDAGIDAGTSVYHDDSGVDASTDAPEEACVPTLSVDRFEVQLAGERSLVWDSSNKVAPNNVADGRVSLYRTLDGRTHLTIPHFENYRLSGTDELSLQPTPSLTFGSLGQASTDQGSYAFRRWLMSPYTEDGQRFFALAHSEWYGCLLHEDDPLRRCSSGNNQIASWVNAITLFRSDDGAATFVPVGEGPDHVVVGPTPPYPSWEYWNAPTPWNYGMFHPSNIVREGNDYYAFVRYTARTSDGSVLRAGLSLLRTSDLSDPGSWRVYDGSSFVLPTEPLPVLEGTTAYDHVGVTYHGGLCAWLLHFFSYADQKLYFSTSATLATLEMSPRRELQGQGHFLVTADALRPGFVAANYATLIDPSSVGFQLDRSVAAPYLYYSSFDPSAVLERDIYRVPLRITEAPFVPFFLPEGPFLVGAEIFYANAEGAYCRFSSFESFVALTGRTSTSEVPLYGSIPSSMTDEGICQG